MMEYKGITPPKSNLTILWDVFTDGSSTVVPIRSPLLKQPMSKGFGASSTGLLTST